MLANWLSLKQAATGDHNSVSYLSNYIYTCFITSTPTTAVIKSNAYRAVMI